MYMQSIRFSKNNLVQTLVAVSLLVLPLAASAADPSVSGLDQPAPIKGFHPIKRAMQPVENLEALSIKLEQQIMKLEGPIAGLHPPMVDLENRMNAVDNSMKTMEIRVTSVNDQMQGVRSDLAQMQSEIGQLKEPIEAIEKPVETVSQPLENVKRQLNLVLTAIVIAGFAIVFGTPFTAVLTYRYRDKLFPPDRMNSTNAHRAMVAK